MHKCSWKAFTIVELLIVIIIIAVGLISAYSIVDYAINFVDGTRTKVLAINYAREWVEWVFNIRDTNWKRWSWEKDKCWLKIDPLKDEGSPGCENDKWFGSGHYILISADVWSEKYYKLEKKTSWLNIFDGDASDDKDYLLCLTGWFIEACPGSSFKNANTTSLFFREVKGGFLEDKNSWTDISNCSNWNDSQNGINCWSASSKEKNFCVIVQYLWLTQWEVKFCSSMTNFR